MRRAGVEQDDTKPEHLRHSMHTDKGRRRLPLSPAGEGPAIPLGVGCLQKMDSGVWLRVEELTVIAANIYPKSGSCTHSPHAPTALRVSSHFTRKKTELELDKCLSS